MVEIRLTDNSRSLHQTSEIAPRLRDLLDDIWSKADAGSGCQVQRSYELAQDCMGRELHVVLTANKAMATAEIESTGARHNFIRTDEDLDQSITDFLDHVFSLGYNPRQKLIGNSYYQAYAELFKQKPQIPYEFRRKQRIRDKIHIAMSNEYRFIERCYLALTKNKSLTDFKRFSNAQSRFINFGEINGISLVFDINNEQLLVFEGKYQESKLARLILDYDEDDKPYLVRSLDNGDIITFDPFEKTEKGQGVSRIEYRDNARQVIKAIDDLAKPAFDNSRAAAKRFCQGYFEPETAVPEVSVDSARIKLEWSNIGPQETRLILYFNNSETPTLDFIYEQAGQRKIEAKGVELTAEPIAALMEEVKI